MSMQLKLHLPYRTFQGLGEFLMVIQSQDDAEDDLNLSAYGEKSRGLGEIRRPFSSLRCMLSLVR